MTSVYDLRAETMSAAASPGGISTAVRPLNRFTPALMRKAWGSPALPIMFTTLDVRPPKRAGYADL